MIAPEMEVVVVVGQAGAKSELRRHEIVAVPFAVDVAEPAEEKAPIETLRDPALAHRKCVRQTVGHVSEGGVAVAVQDAGAVRAGGSHHSQIAAAGDEPRGGRIINAAGKRVGRTAVDRQTFSGGGL